MTHPHRPSNVWAVLMNRLRCPVRCPRADASFISRALCTAGGPTVPRSAPRLHHGLWHRSRASQQPQTFPWLDHKETPAQARKRRWMRRGGALITVWRRLRRGDLNSWQSAVYGVKRLARILRRGADLHASPASISASGCRNLPREQVFAPNKSRTPLSMLFKVNAHHK